jgi:hypothetical protein
LGAVPTVAVVAVPHVAGEEVLSVVGEVSSVAVVEQTVVRQFFGRTHDHN